MTVVDAAPWPRLAGDSDVAVGAAVTVLGIMAGPIMIKTGYDARLSSGAIAAEQVKSATPDGYTLMWTISTTMIMNKVLFKKLPYDPDKDFVPISWMDAGHLPTIVNAKLPIKDLADLDKFARANKTSLGTYGAGSYSHVAVEALNRHFKLQMEAVHYRGEALMWVDVGSGSLTGGSGSYAAASNVLQTGNGRPIAVPTKKRMRKLPDVPTFLEQGVSDVAHKAEDMLGMFRSGSLPIRKANADYPQRKFAGVVLVSDNESWVTGNQAFALGARGSTGVMTEWQKFVANQQRLGNDRPKLVCIDLQAYTTTQAPEREDILNVGGFSDAVFSVVSAFLSGDASRFVAEVEAVEL